MDGCWMLDIEDWMLGDNRTVFTTRERRGLGDSHWHNQIYLSTGGLRWMLATL